MKKKEISIYKDIIARYLLTILASSGGLFIFYAIFTPLTVYFIFYALKIFIPASLVNTTIYLTNFTIELIPACIAGSAYYLLFALNMLTSKIKLDIRLKLLIFSFTALFILNFLRIIILIIMAKHSLILFDFAHQLFWYFLNLVMVVIIWFAGVFLFNIKTIPVYSDVKEILKKIKK